MSRVRFEFGTDGCCGVVAVIAVPALVAAGCDAVVAAV